MQWPSLFPVGMSFLRANVASAVDGNEKHGAVWRQLPTQSPNSEMSVAEVSHSVFTFSLCLDTGSLLPRYYEMG